MDITYIVSCIDSVYDICRVQTAECKLQTADCRLQTADRIVKGNSINSDIIINNISHAK